MSSGGIITLNLRAFKKIYLRIQQTKEHQFRLDHEVEESDTLQMYGVRLYSSRQGPARSRLAKVSQGRASVCGTGSNTITVITRDMCSRLLSGLALLQP